MSSMSASKQSLQILSRNVVTRTGRFTQGTLEVSCQRNKLASCGPSTRLELGSGAIKLQLKNRQQRCTGRFSLPELLKKMLLLKLNTIVLRKTREQNILYISTNNVMMSSGDVERIKYNRCCHLRCTYGWESHCGAVHIGERCRSVQLV